MIMADNSILGIGEENAFWFVHTYMKTDKLYRNTKLLLPRNKGNLKLRIIDRKKIGEYLLSLCYYG